jgi:hypothetical protein
MALSRLRTFYLLTTTSGAAGHGVNVPVPVLRHESTPVAARGHPLSVTRNTDTHERLRLVTV